MKATFISWKNVVMSGGLLGEKQNTNIKSTIPYLCDSYEETGRFDFIKGNWTVESGYEPHHFWDSDIAKLIEAIAYTLTYSPDQKLEEKVDEMIADLGKIQMEDGYLNTYFSTFCPENRFTDLMMMHELYCAGHLIEAALAYYEATGKRTLLEIMERYLTFIDQSIGAEKGKIHGYDGHPEIELALMKLYRMLDDEKYYRMSEYYIEARGRSPYFFEEEAKKQGLDLTKEKTDLYDIGSFLVKSRMQQGAAQEKNLLSLPKSSQERVYRNYLQSVGPYAQFSANLPVRELKRPAGHAVRAMYLYCGMADLALHDTSLQEACKRLWKELVTKQVYITGGIGQSQECERFSFEYDLPNEGNYCETCASIGLFMWAQRMLTFDLDGNYGDMMEKALYNGILSGCSSDGSAFFYANHMSLYPKQYTQGSSVIRSADRISPVRRRMFTISCCPANYSRLIASVGNYFYSVDKNNIYIHMYNSSVMHYEIDGNAFEIQQSTDYPRSGRIVFTIRTNTPMFLGIAFRIPGWCVSWECMVNGEKEPLVVEKGYVKLPRTWKDMDQVILEMNMEPRLYIANPKVRQDDGKIAVMKGPVVYCLEEIDNFPDLNDFALLKNCHVFEEETQIEGFPVLRLTGSRSDMKAWGEELYQPVSEEKRVPAHVKAIPYYLWANRGLGEMIVWIRSE